MTKILLISILFLIWAGISEAKSGPFGLGFGIEWRPVLLPLGVFFEIVPGISVIPEIGFFGNGGLGLRYFF